MTGVKPTSSSRRATLIGDVVASRRSPNRSALHRAVTGALTQATDDAVDAPALTVGDEFQGSYRTVGAAITAALAIRLALAADHDPGVDVRFGIGWGGVTMLDERIQDGPGWWSAREAIVASSSVATAMMRPRRARTSAMLLNTFS